MEWVKTLIWKVKFANRYYVLCGGYWRHGFYCAGIFATDCVDTFEELMLEDPADMAYEELTSG